MPRLLLFAPCIKSIVDKDEGNISLIAVIESVRAQIPPSEPIPSRAVAPIQWSAVSSWLGLPEDAGKRFEQRVQLITPDQMEAISAVVPFEMTMRTHHVMTSINAFPVSQTGELILRLQIHEVGESHEWETVAEYPILVVHAVQGELNRA